MDEHSYDYERGRTDLAYFAVHAVPEHVPSDPPEFHRAIWALMQDPATTKKWVVAPRGHAKTTCVLIYLLHQIAYRDSKVPFYIVTVSESGDQASLYLEDLKNVLADGVAFPQLFPRASGRGPTWGADAVETNNNVYIESLGTRQKLRGRKRHGMRIGLLVMDDFESPETDSPLERRRISSWAFGAAKYALKRPSGQFFAIGTVTFEDAFLATVQKAKGWAGIFLRAKYEDGDPHQELYGKDGMLWGVPCVTQEGETVAFDLVWWERAREEAISEGMLPIFNREIQNELSGSEEDFDPLKFKCHEGVKFEDGLTWVERSGEWRPVSVALGVDSSTREHQTADWCVLMPVGTDSDGYCYQLPYERGRYGKDVTRIADEVFRLHDIYGFNTAAVETIQAQVYIQGELERQMQERGVYFTIVPLNPRKGKDSRVYSMKPRIDAGKLLFHPTCNEQLMNELARYRVSKFKDTADALQMAVSVARPFRAKVDWRPRAVDEYGRAATPRWNWKTERWAGQQPRRAA